SPLNRHFERSRLTFSSAFAPARFLRPGWFCGTKTPGLRSSTGNTCRKMKRTLDSLGGSSARECRQCVTGGSPPCPGLLPNTPEPLARRGGGPTPLAIAQLIQAATDGWVDLCSFRCPGCPTLALLPCET